MLVSSTRAQFLDLARVEYTYVPGTKTNFEYSRIRTLFNMPMRIKEGTYFFMGLDYSRIQMEFEEDVDSFDKSETDDFTLVDVNFAYTFPINNDWRFGIQVTPGLSSNFENKLEWDDAVISSIIAFNKDKKDDPPSGKKPFRIIIGAAYSGNSGIPFPIPFLSFYKKFKPKWSYNLGAPISNLQWHTSEKVRMKLFATLDGFNANLHRKSNS